MTVGPNTESIEHDIDVIADLTRQKNIVSRLEPSYIDRLRTWVYRMFGGGELFKDIDQVHDTSSRISTFATMEGGAMGASVEQRSEAALGDLRIMDSAVRADLEGVVDASAKSKNGLRFSQEAENEGKLKPEV